MRSGVRRYGLVRFGLVWFGWVWGAWADGALLLSLGDEALFIWCDDVFFPPPFVFLQCYCFSTLFMFLDVYFLFFLLFTFFLLFPMSFAPCHVYMSSNGDDVPFFVLFFSLCLNFSSRFFFPFID